MVCGNVCLENLISKRIGLQVKFLIKKAKFDDSYCFFVCTFNFCKSLIDIKRGFSKYAANHAMQILLINYFIKKISCH